MNNWTEEQTNAMESNEKLEVRLWIISLVGILLLVPILIGLVVLANEMGVLLK
jgi:hypothetical protein